MTRKLTLSVDADVIDAAKRYAAEHGTSVSRMVEAYLAAVTIAPAQEEVPPVLRRWQGRLEPVPESEHRAHLAQKYGT